MDLGSLFAQFLGGPASPVMVELGLTLKEWGTSLSRHALAKWPLAMASGFRCGFDGGCGRPAIGACVICQKPTCLEHSFVSADAIPVCYHCVKFKRAAPPPPPSGAPAPNDVELRKTHLRTLKLSSNATNDDIKAAFKKLAIKFHPDRVGDPVKKAVAEKKFKEINTAYQWLISKAGS